ncbi:TrkH family potassium uptake protein [Nocardioides coralli]|uniref:TrkH family potassium uptake protein n=1 Tax=Nocardioides coralli TaxID=2872154 RepID=UPI001CA3DB2B|nr:potassium transporter TrkG [Nocardioides coralli]QZY27605.1 TrkH family potassium uptake protein [Nocardioides coralli]
MHESAAGGRPPRSTWLRNPAQAVVLAFALVIVLGTLLLMLPVASADGRSAPLTAALFTSTSAVCVTGLVVVDTASYWSDFGEVVILALIQVGGFGIMTFATLLGLLVWRRLGLRSRMTAATETKSLGLGEVGTVVKGVVLISVAFELVTAAALTLRFALAYDLPWGRAGYLGGFHAVSAFNNAGFALYPDSLVRFASDPWICLPIAGAVIAGGLGFPVWLELARRRRGPWSIHTRITLIATTGLFLAGAVLVTANEWDNPGTLGGLEPSARFLAGFFHGVMPRTAGFNSLDVAAMEEGTLLGTVVLMFIGGGSAGTAGGIKVTTFVLLFFAIYAEVRGERDVEAFQRRIGDRAVRQALAVALLGVAAVVGATFVLLVLTDLETGPVLFEAASAFGTVGLSTGITAALPTSAQLVLVGLMFLGRLGPITLVSALAMRERGHLHRLPEGRPIIG